MADGRTGPYARRIMMEINSPLFPIDMANLNDRLAVQGAINSAAYSGLDRRNVGSDPDKARNAIADWLAEDAAKYLNT